MQELLNIERFLKTAQEEDLFVIVRPGPFICAEFEFGGFPSWLLRERDIKVRTRDEKYMKHVRRYFDVLLTLLAAFQFTNGGSVIAFQVENEYASTEEPNGNPPFMPDLVYVEELRKLMLKNGIKELLFTADSAYDYGSDGSLPTLFQTANFGDGPEDQFKALLKAQGNKPYMATEFWGGWFDHWSEQHHRTDVQRFSDIYERILKYPASVNLYMFHGGTTWGFMNGANKPNLLQSTLQPDTTSYDYDAPLTENGDYNPKYYAVKDLLKKYSKIKVKQPDVPKPPQTTAYESVLIRDYLPYEDIISQLPYNIKSNKLVSMEFLPINNNSGQSYGYILYRKSGINITKGSVLEISSFVYDHVNVYINNKLITQNVVDLEAFGYWRKENSTLVLTKNDNIINATLDLVVENIGRCNFGRLATFNQFKGLWHGVFIDGNEILDWEILPMEFKKKWNVNLTNWKVYNSSQDASYETGLYRTEFEVEDVKDTFIDMSNWRKGFVIVNDFVLGRYWKIGPEQALYLPAPLLKKGRNEIVVFEEFYPENEIQFSSQAIFFNNLL